MRSIINTRARRAMSALSIVALTAGFLALGACGGSGDGNQSQTGTLNLGMTDGPVDAADAVVVQFSGVELKPVNGAAFSIDFAPKTIDVLGLRGTNRAMLLDGEKVPAGDYEWMRLKVNADPNVAGDSYITVDGAQCEMRIPSGSETGLKLIRGFTVGVGTITDFTIDFDLRKSVVRPPGQTGMMEACAGQIYMLKPVMRVVDNLQVGTIAGTIDPTLVSQQCGTDSSLSQVAPGNVYLFGPYATGDAVPVPDDVDGVSTDGADPITSAMVELDSSSNNSYTIGFVPAGNYVVAYTCSPDQPDVDADLADSPTGADEAVTFSPAAGAAITVSANQTTTQNFGP